MINNIIDLSTLGDEYREKDGTVAAIVCSAVMEKDDVLVIFFETENKKRLRNQYNLPRGQYALSSLVKAALGQKTTQFAPEDLVGCKVLLEIANNSTYSNIKRVFPFIESTEHEVLIFEEKNDEIHCETEEIDFDLDESDHYDADQDDLGLDDSDHCESHQSVEQVRRPLLQPNKHRKRRHLIATRT
jgi:hypothetical protein